MPLGSAYGSPFFNSYLNDLFYLTEPTNLCNCADDATFYACNKDLNFIINRFIKMKNQDKCLLLIYENVWGTNYRSKNLEK